MNIMISAINHYFETVEANDICYGGDIVKCPTNIVTTKGLSLLSLDIIVSPIVISSFD
jgi:hypothetical protein